VRTIVAGPARGLRMEVDFAYQLRFYLGVFERELVPWYRRFCAPGAGCFDVGAREGYVALGLARLSPGGRVVAFEMDETEYGRLLRNIAANPDVRPVPEACLARVADRSDGKSKLSLDDAAYGRYFVPDLVKLDVEGSELKALHGAERLLTERRPHLVVETHSAELERSCVELLERHGYEAGIVRPRRWSPEVREGHNRWLVAEGRPSKA